MAEMNEIVEYRDNFETYMEEYMNKDKYYEGQHYNGTHTEGVSGSEGTAADPINNEISMLPEEEEQTQTVFPIVEDQCTAFYRKLGENYIALYEAEEAEKEEDIQDVKNWWM